MSLIAHDFSLTCAQVTNHKLFHRAVRIVTNVAGVGVESASHALLRSLYRCDTVSQDIQAAQMQQHIDMPF